MDNVDDTKLRLIREAIQHNLERGARTRAGASARSRRVFPLGLLGLLLAATFTHLSAPPVVSRGSLSAPDAAGADPASPPASAVNPVEIRDVPAAAPRPLGPAVLPLSIKKIVVDPGHGGVQYGAISDSGLPEKEVTLDIALRLRRLMQHGPFEVMLTRETDDTIPLAERVAFANAHHADLFVSIHVNWIPRREVRPLETYYIGPTDDPAALRLAGIENRDSGYSLSDYRRLLEKIYIDTRRSESETLARTIHTELFRSLSEVNPALANRGVKMAPFVVLVGTEMPAILAEVSCLSNADDVGLLTKAEYRDRIAGALLRGIRSYANALNPVSAKGS